MKSALLLIWVTLPTWVGTAADEGMAGPREQARKIHDRLAGVPPSKALLTQMAALIEGGDVRAAAALAIDTDTFLNITIKNMAKSWTNAEESIDFPLNDYSATVIGMIRDELPFNQILTTNIIYTGPQDGALIPAYDPATNDHYEAFEDNSLSLTDDLIQGDQIALTQLPITSGVLTSRGFGQAYYDMGTNRRPVAGTLKTFLCRDMEQLSDVTRPDLYIRQDVDRAPGGDPLAFRNKCAGCHSGMDPLSKAFTHFDFSEGRVLYDETIVPDKVTRNAQTFPGGFVTGDAQWNNLWNSGQNATLGFKDLSGTGPETYGQLLAESDAFPACMSERVFTKVCLREPLTTEDQGAVAALAQEFVDGAYNMKVLFQGAAQHCLMD